MINVPKTQRFTDTVLVWKDKYEKLFQEKRQFEATFEFQRRNLERMQNERFLMQEKLDRADSLEGNAPDSSEPHNFPTDKRATLIDPLCSSVQRDAAGHRRRGR